MDGKIKEVKDEGSYLLAMASIHGVIWWTEVGKYIKQCEVVAPHLIPTVH